ncbi:Alpha/beta hydrolase fold-1 - like 9 [Theobroma cacao]|nr:Alpha/beta hydrolase fold-1 - like 9 [Theobroma cacao]
MTEFRKQKHFILVHGACHGAWCWYKLKPRLESAGHRVTAIDLAASGINMNAIQSVHTMNEYTKPLLEILASLPPGEKVILVGHSLGGLNLALAMDKFPEKISAGVFLTAFMPDTAHQPSFVLEQYWKRTPAEAWLDTEFAPYGRPEQSLMSMFFGPKFLTYKLYQLSPVEDLELAKALIRPGSLFVSDLSKADKLSNERYGCVPRVYIVCNEDKGIPEKFQRWMIENFEVNDVMEIKDADHMAMFSKPQELCDCLSEIAQKYE